MKKEGLVTMGLSEYEELRYAANKLVFLEDFGVDDWEEYGEAMAAFNSFLKEEELEEKKRKEKWAKKKAEWVKKPGGGGLK